MRSIGGSIPAALLGLLALSEGAAAAAPARQGVRLDPLQPASPESWFVRAEGPYAPAGDAVELALGLGVEVASAPLRAVGVDAGGGEEVLADVVDYAVFARIGASITPAPWLALELSVPFAVYVDGKDQGTVSYAGEEAKPASAHGLGDPRFGVHVRAVDTQPFDLLLGSRLWAPVGSSDAYASDKRLRWEIDLGVAGEAGAVLYGCTLSAAPTLVTARDGDRASAALAVHALLVPEFSLGIEPSVALVVDEGPDEQGSVGVIVEPLAASRLRLGGLRLGLAGGPVFGQVAGAGEFRGIFSVAFVGGGRPEAKPPAPARPADRDLDGIVDGADACPDQAGPDSRDAAERGCPAQDRDGDGVRDAEDACPDKAGMTHPERKANGCPDADNDLLPDPIDGCAAEPGPQPAGCPSHARMGKDAFAIHPPIGFQGDRLTAEGLAALEEVAATVRANPKIEQISVQLGTRGVSARTSDRRAAAILTVLRAGYLSSDRYEVVLRDDLAAGTVQIRILR